MVNVAWGARKGAARATSSAAPSRPSGGRGLPRPPGASIQPGATALTRMPRETSSVASACTADGGGIRKEFRFPDYFRTMAFVNAVASIAHREDHHPDLEVHYDRCVVHYSTHDVGGLSLNDVICAARVEDIRAA